MGDSGARLDSPDGLFTKAVRRIFNRLGSASQKEFPILQSVQPVMIVGRDVTSDTQTFDEIVDAQERLRVNVFAHSGTILTGATWAALEIGDWAWANSGEGAGNAVVLLPTSSPTDEMVFEVHQILQQLDNDGTAASRVMTLTVVTDMNSVSPWALNDFAHTGPTATANENASVFIPRAPGLIQNNDNGTITTTDSRPLPVMLGNGGTITSTITAGVAGDVHGIACLVRRVA